MPNCYICNKGTPVTQFWLLRIYQEIGAQVWYYACGVACLKSLVRDKTQGYDHFLLREYMTACGKAQEFLTREELVAYIDKLH